MIKDQLTSYIAIQISWDSELPVVKVGQNRVGNMSFSKQEASSLPIRRAATRRGRTEHVFQQQRQARISSSLQIRRQKRESWLRTKRFAPPFAVAAGVSSSVGGLEQQFEHAASAYVRISGTHGEFQSFDFSWEVLHPFQQALSSVRQQHPSSATYLYQLFETKYQPKNEYSHSLATLVVDHTIQHLQRVMEQLQNETQSDTISTLDALLSILLDLSSLPGSIRTNQDDEDDNLSIYGPVSTANPRTWCELLLQSKAVSLSNSSLLELLTNPLLLQGPLSSTSLVSAKSETPKSTLEEGTTTQKRSSSAARTLGKVAATILGNLVLELGSKKVLYQPMRRRADSPLITSMWSDLVAALPLTLFPVSCLVQQDITTLGMDLLRGANLTPVMISNFFLMLQQEQLRSDTSSEESILVDAAWLVEGLLRREDQVTLAFGEEDSLITTLVQLLQELVQAGGIGEPATTSIASTQWRQILTCIIPILRSLGYLATGAEGRFVPKLLQVSNGALLASLRRLLQIEDAPPPQPSTGDDSGVRRELRNQLQSLRVEAIALAGYLLCDTGTPNHPSTSLVPQVLLPALVQLAVHPMSKFETRRDALSAIWNGITEPPGVSSSILSEEIPTNKVRWEMDSNLCKILQDYVWPGSTGEPASHLRKSDTEFLQCCVDMLRHQDMEAVMASVAILDRILRILPASRELFASLGGIDRLEQIVETQTKEVAQFASIDGGPSASDIAGNLIDDFFDGDNENDFYDPDSLLDSLQFSSPGGGNATDDEDEMNDAIGVSRSSAATPPLHCVFGGGGRLDLSSNLYDFSSNDAVSSFHLAPQTMQASGRGRGRPIPSWMTQQSSSGT
jgi:hypothetical protein